MGITAAIEQAMSRHRAFQADGVYGLLKVGEAIGDWRVLALLGSGGNGEVYRVEHVTSGVIGALKVPVPNNQRLRARFDFELEILRKIASERKKRSWLIFHFADKTPQALRHFPLLLDNGEITGKNVPYLVIEHLQEMKELPSNDSEVRKLILGVGEAIGALHKLGYLHRDVKPENVMLRENGEVVLIDFGLAVRIEDLANPIADRISMTQGRACGVGTEGSSAPEQSYGHASVRSDVFALGSLANDCFGADPPANWRPTIQKALNPREDNRQCDVDEFMRAVKKNAPWRRWTVRILLIAIICTAIFPLCRLAFNGFRSSWEASQLKCGELSAEVSALRLKLAERGDADEQYKQGLRFKNGNGVRRDLPKALAWFRKAAEQGHAHARRELGRYHGNTVQLIREAAEQGEADSQCALAQCYLDGCGIRKNPQNAILYYRKAAEQGNAEAFYGLGICHEEGSGVENDPNEAVKWYRKAADMGHANAQVKLGQCYGNGVGVEKDPAAAVKWYRKAAEQGDAWGLYCLGVSYENGEGVGKNVREAVECYRKAAERGFDEAEFVLGDCYEKGIGVTKNFSEATRWYCKAAEQGHERARKALGQIPMESIE